MSKDKPQVESFALFSDDDIKASISKVKYVNHRNNSFVNSSCNSDSNVSDIVKEDKEAEEGPGTKPERTPDSSKESVRVESNVDNNRRCSKKATTGDPKDKSVVPSKDSSDDVTRQAGKSNGGKINVGGIVGSDTERCGCKTRETVIGDASNVKRKTGRRKASEETEFYNTIMPPRQITGTPKPVRGSDLIEIVVDGSVMRVSPWSVKNGIYTQGLDSNYIVFHFKADKK